MSRENCAAAVELIQEELKKWNPPSMFTEVGFFIVSYIILSLLSLSPRACYCKKFIIIIIIIIIIGERA